MKKNLLFIGLALLSMLMIGCNNENPGNGGSTATKIKSISIKGTNHVGVVDADASTVVFNDVAAETPVEALVFTVDLYLGANLDKEVYDFTAGASTDGKQYIGKISVINGASTQEYTVTLNLLDPTADPKVAKLEVKNAAGETKLANINHEAHLIALGMSSESEATLVNIELFPTRANYEFTAINDGVLTADQPGQLKLEFMGKTSVYDITFDDGVASGANLSEVVVYDFSVTSGSPYADFMRSEGEGTAADFYTRGTDFDGEHVLIVSRSNKTTATPHLLKVSDLKAGNTNKTSLKVPEHEAETEHYPVSSGRLSHGHIYICNLVTSLGAEENGHTFRVYHYANASATPDVWEWDGLGLVDEYGDELLYSRLGDNMSINLDENGNGYAFFCGQEDPADFIISVEIKNFNEFSTPTFIPLEDAFSYYAYINQVAEERYLITSHYMPSISLIDREGTSYADVVFLTTASGLKPQTGVDPRIVEFNNGTYLLFATPRNNTMHKGVGPALYMVDITEGAKISLVKALEDLGAILFNEMDKEVADRQWEPDYHYSLDKEDAALEAHRSIAAPAAQCNAAVVDGKLLVFVAATDAGFAIFEFPAAE